jgi:hypothetical protein
MVDVLARDAIKLFIDVSAPEGDTAVSVREGFRLITHLIEYLDDPRVAKLVVKLLVMLCLNDDAKRIAYEFDVDDVPWMKNKNAHLDFTCVNPWILHDDTVLENLPATKFYNPLVTFRGPCEEFRFFYIRPHMTFALSYDALQGSIAAFAFRLPTDEFYEGCGVAPNSLAIFMARSTDLGVLEENLEFYRNDQRTFVVWVYTKQDYYGPGLKSFREKHLDGIVLDKGITLLMYRSRLIWNIHHMSCKV